MKNVDIAFYNYLKTVADGSVQADISTGALQNGGVGLAPFHDWEGKIPAELKSRIQQASDGIKDGPLRPSEVKSLLRTGCCAQQGTAPCFETEFRIKDMSLALQATQAR